MKFWCGIFSVPVLNNLRWGSSTSMCKFEIKFCITIESMSTSWTTKKKWPPSPQQLPFQSIMSVIVTAEMWDSQAEGGRRIAAQDGNERGPLASAQRLIITSPCAERNRQRQVNNSARECICIYIWPLDWGPSSSKIRASGYSCLSPVYL